MGGGEGEVRGREWRERRKRREKKRREEKGRKGDKRKKYIYLKYSLYFSKKLGGIVLTLYQTGCFLHEMSLVMKYRVFLFVFEEKNAGNEDKSREKDFHS